MQYGNLGPWQYRWAQGSIQLSANYTPVTIRIYFWTLVDVISDNAQSVMRGIGFILATQVRRSSARRTTIWASCQRNWKRTSRARQAKPVKSDGDGGSGPAYPLPRDSEIWDRTHIRRRKALPVVPCYCHSFSPSGALKPGFSPRTRGIDTMSLALTTQVAHHRLRTKQLYINAQAAGSYIPGGDTVNFNAVATVLGQQDARNRLSWHH